MVLLLSVLYAARDCQAQNPPDVSLTSIFAHVIENQFNTNNFVRNSKIHSNVFYFMSYPFNYYFIKLLFSVIKYNLIDIINYLHSFLLLLGYYKLSRNAFTMQKENINYCKI